MENKPWFQQGDVCMLPVEDIPGECEKKNHTILAEGEATGHAHRAKGAGCTVFEAPTGELFLDAPNGAEVTHEEHGPHSLPPGKYKIGIVQEYDHFMEESREVRD